MRELKGRSRGGEVPAWVLIAVMVVGLVALVVIGGGPVVEWLEAAPRRE